MTSPPSTLDLDLISTAFDGVKAVVAIVAVWVAYYQFKKTIKHNRESAAFDSMDNYAKLCFENPHFGHSKLAKEYLGIDNFENFNVPRNREHDRYVWFISYMLTALEKVINEVESDPCWVACVKNQIRYHCEVLAHVWIFMRAFYGAEFVAIVDEVIHEYFATDPSNPNALRDINLEISRMSIAYNNLIAAKPEVPDNTFEGIERALAMRENLINRSQLGATHA